MTFYVGQKVVCVDAGNVPAWWYRGEIRPRKNTIYTIREFDGPSAIRLVEITNRLRCYREGVGELSFYLRRFRPITEWKTDISIFNRMLNPKSVEIA